MREPLRAPEAAPAPPPSQIGEDVLTALCACAAATPPGAIVEVGVFQGGSAYRLAQVALAQKREIWLYDTFTGIPYAGPHDSHKVGDFNAPDLEASVRAAIPRATIVKGIFPGSARLFHPLQAIAFLHLDCDQEQAYDEAIAWAWPRMAPGGVMWFDDSCLLGAQRAIRRAFSESQLRMTCGKWWVTV